MDCEQDSEVIEVKQGSFPWKQVLTAYFLGFYVLDDRLCNLKCFIILRQASRSIP